MKLNVVDLAQMKYEEQIKVKLMFDSYLVDNLIPTLYFKFLQLIRNSNVIVGVHGAGLMNIMFAAEEVHANLLHKY